MKGILKMDKSFIKGFILLVVVMIIIGFTIQHLVMQNPAIKSINELANKNGNYLSFCEGDAACEKRELDFIRETGRTPATDSELIDVYNIPDDRLLFEGHGPQPIQKPLPPDVYCDDCENEINATRLIQ